jgi:Flp pilus assembly protein TadG
MGNKGQALVEFILVLPILILLIFGMIEIGNLVYQKYKLETHVDSVIELYENEEELLESYKEKNDIDVLFSKSGNLVTVTISKDFSLITPGVTNFIGNPIHLKAERTFYVGD